MIKDYFECKPVPQNERFKFVDSIGQRKVKFKAEALLIKNSIDSSVFERIKKNIMQYIPAAL